MSAVLKDGTARAAAIRPIGAWRGAAAEDPTAPLAAELQEARTLLAAATTRNAELESACIEARRQGEAEGFERGRLQAEEARAEALLRLEEGVHAAEARLAEELASLERLAVLLARESVSILVGDPRYQAEMVERAIATQIGKLEAASILQVAVSPADFGDEAALARLADAAGVGVSADPALPTGACRMALRLGNVEVGPADQWPRVAALLTELGGIAA